jgi:menaquinone-specific isochorismate synthase
MPVMPNDFHLLDSPHSFKELIFLAKSEENNDNIVSISYTINSLDPLVFLSVMKDNNQRYFYWENQRKQEAVIAIGDFKSLQVSGSYNHKNVENINRFQQCQNFVKDTLNKNNLYNKSFPLATIFLPHIQLLKKRDTYTLTVNTYNNYHNINEIKKYIRQNFSEKIVLNYKFKTEKENKLNYNLEERQYQSFIDKVNQGLEAIKEQKLTKIVVSHALEVKINKNFNVIKSLENLRNNYPDCYIFAVNNKDQEHFIGASPERLLSIKNNQIISDALAGSAPRGKNQEDDQKIGENLLNSEKEKREHQIVSDFIFEQLLTMNLQPKKAPLQLLKLSNIQHLWTPISAKIINNINLFEIINKLHPTPAMAGEPITIACDKIESSENFDRSLYAAPIGWLNSEKNCEFIVGIRSALIKENSARLYAGAGIVAGSKPEQELTEIQLKFKALLEALR